jgi:hypothetical protein
MQSFLMKLTNFVPGKKSCQNNKSITTDGTIRICYPFCVLLGITSWHHYDDQGGNKKFSPFNLQEGKPSALGW